MNFNTNIGSASFSSSNGNSSNSGGRRRVKPFTKRVTIQHGSCVVRQDSKGGRPTRPRPGILKLSVGVMNKSMLICTAGGNVLKMWQWAGVENSVPKQVWNFDLKSMYSKECVIQSLEVAWLPVPLVLTGLSGSPPDCGLKCNAGYVHLLSVDGKQNTPFLQNPSMAPFSHTQSVTTIKLLPGGFVATGSADTTIRLWNVQSMPPKLQKPLSGHVRAVKSIQFIPQSKTLYTASADNSIMSWSEKMEIKGCTRANRKAEGGKHHHAEGVNALEVFNDGSKIHLLSASFDKTIRMWDPTNLRCEYQITTRQIVTHMKVLQVQGGKAALICGTMCGKILAYSLPRLQFRGSLDVGSGSRGGSRGNRITDISILSNPPMVVAATENGRATIFGFNSDAL